MAIRKTGGAKSAPLDAKVADKLLDLLSSDNEFRRLFKKDPTMALEGIGHRAPPLAPPAPPSVAAPGMCQPVKRIAPKQEFAAARDQLKAHLVSAAIFTNPHCFEAGQVASRSRRK